MLLRATVSKSVFIDPDAAAWINAIAGAVDALIRNAVLKRVRLWAQREDCILTETAVTNALTGTVSTVADLPTHEYAGHSLSGCLQAYLEVLGTASCTTLPEDEDAPAPFLWESAYMSWSRTLLLWNWQEGPL